ncbi:MAG: SDR family NAD(P)-dependent oxidoreductase [Desulfatibacillum sp.]|nr:SDR family NAD(P)-dependent oxidoreductase [Desulfatibacillum sp.]
MPNLQGKRVLITGAANGIGRSMAGYFAKAGCTLILTDLDSQALEAAAEELRQDGVRIYTHQVDVSKSDEVDRMAAKVIANPGIDILINNAGIGHNGEIIETPLTKWKALMDVNFWGPLYHVYAFMPQMIKQGNGHIVNVSSGQAFFRLPTWGPYATIKLALGGFSELLRVEAKKFGIKVTTVYPFMVNTGFYKEIDGETFGTKLSMKLLPFYSMSPDKVAKIIFKAVKKEKSVEMVSMVNDLGYITRLLPPVSNLVSRASLLFLGKDAATLRQEQGI